MIITYAIQPVKDAVNEMTKEEAKQKVAELVKKYEKLKPAEVRVYAHNEQATKDSLIKPLFSALGWNFLDNNEVTPEEKASNGRVDYAFKLNGISQLCLEAKPLKRTLDEDHEKQAINYARYKGLTWAILTNFEELRLFNAQEKKQFISLKSGDYTVAFDDLWLLSKESLEKGLLKKKAEQHGALKPPPPIEKLLYQDLKKWRGELFTQLRGRNKELNDSQIDANIQKLFNRLIFIRTCEDKKLEENMLLAAVRQWEEGGHKGELVSTVKQIFQEYDGWYDSELFAHHPIDGQDFFIEGQTVDNILKGMAGYEFDLIDADILGAVYEQYLGFVNAEVKEKSKLQPSLGGLVDDKVFRVVDKKRYRKEQGIYYTPKHITNYIVKQTIGRYIKEHNGHEVFNIKILDTACGSGSFLIRAYDELLSYHADDHNRVPAQLDLFDRLSVLKRNIFGVDLDKQAVEIARLNLLIRSLAQREVLPGLKDNIKRGNSLISGTPEELKSWFGEDYRQREPFNWSEEFPDIMKNGGFDVVIGNPPYVMELRDNKETFRTLKLTTFGQKYYEPKMDIFYFFIERGIDLLKSGGYLGFIVQEYWTSRSHASKLRKKIFEETWPVTLVDFKDFTVFSEATGQHNMVIILQKTDNKAKNTTVLSIKSSDVIEDEVARALASDVKEQNVFEARTLETSKLYDPATDKVYTSADNISAIRGKLTQNSFNLEDEEIQQGLVTPQDSLTSDSLKKLAASSAHKVGEGIFVLSKFELPSLKLNKWEQKLIKPFHYAEEIDAFYYEPSAKYYLIYTPKEAVADIVANPERYPIIKSHLDKYLPIITSDNKPYGIHRARQPVWFEDTKKIIGVRKTKYPKFSVIPEPWYGDQAVLIIRLVKHEDISPHYVIAVLNSKISHFWLFQQKRQGNQLQVDKEVLLHFPVHQIDLNIPSDKIVYDKLIGLVIKISDHKKKFAPLKDSFLHDSYERDDLIKEISKIKQQIDNLVYDLYGLNEEERNIVEGGL